MTRYEVELTDEQAEAALFVWGAAAGSDEALHLQAAIALTSAIRANPPKPPRMAEPGWGERVMASCSRYAARRTWIRFSDGASQSFSPHMWAGEGGIYEQWDDLIDPEPAS